MDNTTYTLNLLKNSVDTLKYDSLLDRASKNPALGYTSNAFRGLFSSYDYVDFFKIATKEVWQNPAKLNIASLHLNSIKYRALVDSVADLKGSPTPQDIFIALAFDFLRRVFSNLNYTDDIVIQKDIPLVYNFTGAVAGREYYGGRGSEHKSLEWQGDYCPFYGYRSANKEVLRVNLTDKIYSQSEMYGDVSNAPATLNFKENTSLAADVYGNPSDSEIKGIVEKASDSVGIVLKSKVEFEFEITSEKQSELLRSMDDLSEVIFTDEAVGEYASDKDLFKNVLSNQLCVTIGSGTSSNPKKTINAPFSGFFAMLQIAQDLDNAREIKKEFGVVKLKRLLILVLTKK